MDVALLRAHEEDIPESQAIAGERSACFQLFLDYLRDGSTQEREPASDDASHRLFTEIQQQLAESLSDEQIARLAVDARIDPGNLAIFLNGYTLRLKRSSPPPP